MATRQLTTRQVVNLASDPASGTAGEIYYNTVSNIFKYYNGTSWVAISSGGGGGDSLPSQSGNAGKYLTTNGTDPSWASITEDVQDIVGGMVSGNTESGISVTYDDTNGKLDFDVNDPTISLTGDVTGSATMTNLGNVSITTTIAANSVELGTDTTGQYVASVSGTTNQVTVSGSGTEGVALTLSTPQDIHSAANPTFAGATLDAVRVGITAANEIDTTAGNLTIDSAGGTVTVDDNLTVSGNLTINGTISTVNSTTLTVDDPVITLGGDTAPSADDNKDRGIEFRYYDTQARLGFMGYNDSTGQFSFLTDATNTNEVFSGTKATINAHLSGSNINAGTVSASFIDSAIARLASPALSGTPTAPTAAADTNTTQIATTAYVIGQGYLKSSTASSTYAPLASPTFTGTVTAATLDLTTAATATTATSYWVETGSDGVVRPKTLADTRTEIVTTAAVNAAAATTVGTVTSGTWNATTIAVARGGTGLTTSPTNGQLLVGNGTGYTLATITQGTGITVTNGAGSISIANAGITSLSGTTNQIAVSSSTGSSTISLPSAVVFPGTVTLNADPTQALQAATKQYVDAVAQGLHIHASAQTATTANIANLASPPATIDGITLTNGMRVLVKNQSTTSQNGVYVFNAGALTRASDFDTAPEIHGGDFIFVTGGTVNNDTGWVQTETVTTVGTDPILFQQFSGAGTYTAGNGLTLAGSQFSINTGVTADLSTAQTLTNKTINGANNTLTVRLANDITGFGTGVATALAVNVGSAGAFVTLNGALGTPSSATLTNATGLPISGITGLATGIATFLATPTSANLLNAVTDETGSGALVFATSPTLTTPNIGVATGTSFNSITGLSSTTPLVDGTAAVGTATTTARADHVHPTDTSRAPLASPTFTGTTTVPTLTLTTADTATAASHYFIETASDGIVRPKTLANVIAEIVTTTAVNSAAATTVGTVTSGTWNATNIALNRGGTNASLTAAHGGVVYSTASAFAITAAGTAGQVLTSNGAAAPTWQTPASGGAGFDAFLLSGM